MGSDEIAGILGKIPSGLFILTAKGPDGRETGMLASWVMQAGFEPPMLTVAVKRGRYVLDWLMPGDAFNLNVLAADQPWALKHFGKGFEPGEPAFNGLTVERCSRGVAVLTGTVGHLECEAASHLESGDHRILLAKVLGG